MPDENKAIVPHADLLAEDEGVKVSDLVLGGFAYKDRWVNPASEMELMSDCSVREIAYVQEYFRTGGDKKAAKIAYGNEKANATQIEGREHVAKLMLHYRGKMALGMGITRENVLVQLQENAIRAGMGGDFKAVNGALKEVAEIMGWKKHDSGPARVDLQGNVINIIQSTPLTAPLANEEVIDAEVLSEVLAMNGREGADG